MNEPASARGRNQLREIGSFFRFLFGGRERPQIPVDFSVKAARKKVRTFRNDDVRRGAKVFNIGAVGKNTQR
jgi:hypothetical protein